MSTTNPYNFNLPVDPEMFFGRYQDVEILANNLTILPGDSIALIGGRRMGKSSVLKALSRTLEGIAEQSVHKILPVPIFLDLNGEGIDTVTSFFQAVCDCAQDALAELLSLPSIDLNVIETERRLVPAFRRILKEWGRAAITQRGCRLRLVLLLDECEKIVGQSWSSDMHGVLRSLLVDNTIQSMFKTVMAGSHGFLTQVTQHGSPLWNVLKYHKLRVLNNYATRDLIVQPTGGILPDEIVRSVVDQSGGHPFLTQYIMHYLWEYGLEQVTPEAVQDIASLFPHSRRDFWNWVKDLGDTALKIYKVLAQTEGPLTESSIRIAFRPIPPDLVQALDALSYHGLIVQETHGGSYHVTSQMFRTWFAINIAENTEKAPSSQPPPTLQAPISPYIIIQGDYVARDKPTGTDQHGQAIYGSQNNVVSSVPGLPEGKQLMSSVYTEGYALIVGVGADLPNTVNDALGIVNILKDPSRCAYHPEQVHLLTSTQATRDAILTKLDILAEATKSDSTVIVYFSGHGYHVTSPTGEFYYLLPYAYDLNQFYKTAISGTEFASKLKAIRAQKMLVLLDCCHAGGVGDAKAPGLELTKAPLPPEAQQLLAEGSGRVLIASSQENELSYTGKPYSAFTLALIESLCGVGAAKQDGYVRVADLALHAREVVPGRTGNKQHPILNFEQADNFVLAYYAGGDTQPKALPFTEEPQIEPEPGAWKAFDQRVQTVHGSQTNIAGHVQGPVFSGNFQGPVEVGRQEMVNLEGGFYQPNWTVQDNVNQAQHDVIPAGRDVNREHALLAQIFVDAMERVKALPIDDQAVVQPIVEQTQASAEKIQQGDQSAEIQSVLEKRLKNLQATAPDIGKVVIAALTNPAAAVAMTIQKIAKKVQADAHPESSR